MSEFCSEKNKQKFIENVTQSNWSSVYNQSDANDAYDKFISSIEDSYKKCFLVCQLSRKRLKDKPWISSALKKSSVTKNKLYKKWLLTRQPQDEVRYKNFRRVFRKVLLEVETEYFKSKFDFKVNSVKKLWNNLNTVCSASRKVSNNFL